MEFFDRTGAAYAYCPDGTHIFAWDGRAVGYLYEGRVYEFTGSCVAWCHDGWVIDPRGRRVLFTPEATGGPARPRLKSKPLKSVRKPIPHKQQRLMTPARPLVVDEWSIPSL
jgi:hypothetical protein